MTVQQMRSAILKVYNTASWKKKVADMYDDQIIAVYHTFLKRGLIGKVVKNERPVITAIIESSDREGTYEPHKSQQLTIFDFIKEKRRNKQ